MSAEEQELVKIEGGLCAPFTELFTGDPKRVTPESQKLRDIELREEIVGWGGKPRDLQQEDDSIHPI